jgi:hypothetical protein
MAAVPEIQLPKVDLPRVDLPKVEVPRVEMPAFDAPNIDLGATVSQAAEAVGLRRPARRSWWLIALAGAMLAAVAAWGLMRNPEVRARSQRLGLAVRERISAMRPNAWDLDVGDAADPIAFPAADTKPIAPDPWSDTEDLTTPDYPEGLGSDSGDADPVRKESTSRA